MAYGRPLRDVRQPLSTSSRLNLMAQLKATNGRPLVTYGRPIIAAEEGCRRRLYAYLEKLAETAASGRPLKLYGRPLKSQASTLSQISTLLSKSILCLLIRLCRTVDRNWRSVDRSWRKEMNGRPLITYGRPPKVPSPTLSQNHEDGQKSALWILSRLCGTVDRICPTVDRRKVSVDRSVDRL